MSKTNIKFRDPSVVMKLSRLGSFHQSKLSFLRSFIREFKNWNYKKNLFDLNFLKMFYEIIKFYNKSSKLNDIDENLNLGSFLQKEKMSDFFINYHILQMVSAIWSMPPLEASKMPISFFIKFFIFI